MTSIDPITSAEIQKLLDSIDKDMFDCADAIQNALSCVGSRPDPVKAKEYLMDWVPKWMRAETFWPDQVAQKIGTNEIRSYIRTLEDKLETYEAQLRVNKGYFTNPKYQCVWLDAADDIDRTLSSLPTL